MHTDRDSYDILDRARMDDPQRLTKLERFLRAHRIKPAQLAREAGCARQHLLRLRFGLAPRPRLKQAIVEACARLLGRDVAADELFG
jgi:hypothetical protein